MTSVQASLKKGRPLLLTVADSMRTSLDLSSLTQSNVSHVVFTVLHLFLGLIPVADQESLASLPNTNDSVCFPQVLL